MLQFKESSLNKTISVLIVISLFFFSRLINLNSLPVFADEAIYIRWSQVIKNVETLRFIPLTDGKQPLFMWLVVPFLSFFKDPLIAGRFVSILSGFFNLVCVFLITSIILDKTKQTKKDPVNYLKTAISQNYYPSLLASFLYIITPLSLFFDRLATPDNLLTSFILISILLTTLQSKFYRFDISILLGFSLGLAWLTKSPALYYIVITNTLLLLNSQIKKFNIKNIFISLIPAFIATLSYNLLRLGPQFHMIALRNRDYVWPLTEVIKHPLDPLKPHLLAIFNIYRSYVSLPLLIIFVIASIVFLLQKNRKLTFSSILLFLCLIVPILASASMAKVMTGRYIVTSFPIFIICLMYLLSHCSVKLFSLTLLKRALLMFFLFLTFSPNIIKITKIISWPESFNFVDTDKGYINDWTSGWGLADMANYLKSRAQVANVIVGTEGSFGTLPDGLQIYTDGTPQLTIIGLGVYLSQIPPNLIEARDFGDEVYLLINPYRHLLLPSELEKLEPVLTYTRPDKTTTVLYQLKPTRPIAD